VFSGKESILGEEIHMIKWHNINMSEDHKVYEYLSYF
jgi:hypothetical protein